MAWYCHLSVYKRWSFKRMTWKNSHYQPLYHCKTIKKDITGGLEAGDSDLPLWQVDPTVTVLTGLGSRCCGGGLCLLPRLSSLDQHPHYQQWTVFANSSHCNTMFNAILIIKTNHSTPWLTPQVEWQHSLHNLLVTHKNFTQKRKIDLGWFIWWHLTTEISPTKTKFYLCFEGNARIINWLCL